MDAETLIQFAEVQMLQAELAAGPDREILLHEAKDALFRAETLAAGSGSYLLACMHGREGNAALCMRWLERARQSGRLPGRADIEASTHLRAVREAAWFREWLGLIEEESEKPA